ncbi:hypothetical protein ZIOFF_047071 [Zingiber officinale]|uniref:X8 domain-containing protein n=1 Tax=Zingiber officinale TaxID=94328 RepID=A0A8J5KJK9_ZINOF|nr:hypothetical protein ZIOFF_047071 [Zingiber officinale]
MLLHDLGLLLQLQRETAVSHGKAHAGGQTPASQRLAVSSHTPPGRQRLAAASTRRREGDPREGDSRAVGLPIETFHGRRSSGRRISRRHRRLEMWPKPWKSQAALAATISSGRGPWCVAKPEAPREVLQANIEYVCGGAIGDCSAIQEGASCYSTDIVRQASYAMNSFYYAKGGHRSINCFFNETGTKVRDDPSYGNCVYPS